MLVLDEATSALDNLTEQSVLDSIAGLDRELTILLIAHRLTTVRAATDRGARARRGRRAGHISRLLDGSPSFRTMVEATAFP